MNKASVTILLLAGALSAQSGGKQLGPAFKVAAKACNDKTDSGSLGLALRNLSTVEAADPEYPGLKDLKESCTAAHKKLLVDEEQTFKDAKALFDRGGFGEARPKFTALANKSTPYKQEAYSYLSKMSHEPATSVAASGDDYKLLQQADQYINANDREKARAILDRLVAKGGEAAAEAKKRLIFIDTRAKSETSLQQGLQLFNLKRFSEALDIFLKIEQQDPTFNSAKVWSNRARTQGGVPTPPPPPVSIPVSATQRAHELIDQGKYEEGVKLLEAEPKTPENTDLMQRAKVKLQQAKATPKNQDPAHPDPGSPSRLQAGIGEFYAGNYPHAEELLTQYFNSHGKRSEVACFYLGASVYTRLLLSNGNDPAAGQQAREWFSKARKLNPRFSPPKEWISPKIIGLYDQTTRGS